MARVIRPGSTDATTIALRDACAELLRQEALFITSVGTAPWSSYGHSQRYNEAMDDVKSNHHCGLEFCQVLYLFMGCGQCERRCLWGYGEPAQRKLMETHARPTPQNTEKRPGSGNQMVSVCSPCEMMLDLFG